MTSSRWMSPYTLLSGLTLRNRIVLAPLTNRQSHSDGTLGDEELHWLAMRADGGFGAITTCATHVSKDGQGWPGELGIFSDAHLDGLRRLADRVHSSGAAAIAQIFHGGARADASVCEGTPLSASASANGAVRAATEDDLWRIVGNFASAAARAHRAGLDGVEIHGAHGYLLTQFLSRTQNQRTDRWGGSLENRMRLAREVMRAVRDRVPATFTVGVRLSPEDFGQASGLDLDESLEVAKALVIDGADYLHLSLWQAERNTAKRPAEHAIPLFRAVIPENVGLVVAGTIWTPAEVEHLLELGADAVALGRAAIANPDWPNRAKEPDFEPKRPPLTPSELVERGLSPPFVEYMRQWKNFVS